MARLKLDLTVPDRDDFERVLGEARTQGLDVSRSFADLGVISGSIEARALDGLVHIEGIASVAPDRRSPVLPPDGRSATILSMRRT